MSKSRLLPVAILAAVLVTPLFADPLPIGLLSLDPTGSSPNLVTFDIANETGPNDSMFPDMTFPISTPLTFIDFSLVVNFEGGGTVDELPSQFTSDGSGGFTGNFSIDLSAFPLQSALLSGTVDQDSVLLNDGVTTVAIDPNFSALLLPSSGSSLLPGDFSIFSVTQTPEPAGWALLAFGFSVLLGVLFSSGVRHVRP